MATPEGYGAAAAGGSTPFVIDSLADNGTGTARDALSTTGRIITSSVRGVVYLESTLNIPANTTLDTPYLLFVTKPSAISAPWHNLRVTGSNVILRNIRSRYFLPSAGHQEGDCLNLQLAAGLSDILIDHCSLSWGDDECMDFGGCTDVTLQWSIIHQGIMNGTSLGLLIPTGSATRISVHHNLLALSHGRCLGRNASNGIVEFICNGVYGPVDHPSTVDNSSQTDYIKNYYKKSASSTRNYLVDAPNALSTVYHSGNACENCSGFTTMSAGSIATISGTPLASPSTPVTQEATALDAWNAILAGAGASYRDTFDQQVIDRAKFGTGGIISDPLVEIAGVCQLPF